MKLALIKRHHVKCGRQWAAFWFLKLLGQKSMAKFLPISPYKTFEATENDTNKNQDWQPTYY